MKRGFTLIELLVVIAIIAILAAILFPVFARARDKARQASCQSNMKQIALAAMMYVQDYDETFPAFYHYWTPGDSSTRYIGYYDAFAPYTMNEQIYICPSGRFTYDYWRRGLPNPEGFYGVTQISSYGVVVHHSHIAHLGTGMWLGGWGGGGHSLAEMERPAEKILVAEMRSILAGTPAQMGFTEDGAPAPMDNPDTGQAGHMMYRHSGQMNAAYADGHVKSIPQLTTPDPLLR